MSSLKEKIAELEEYCLNVDHHNIPVPEKLQYLFTKTQGTYKMGSAVYNGQMIRSKPSGQGKTCFEDGTTHEGQYVNGMRHGKGKNTDKNKNLVQICTWKLDEMDGISKETFEDGRVRYGVYKQNSNTFIVKCKLFKGKFTYADMNNGKRCGFFIEYYTTEDYIVVYTYDAGEKQGKGKKYTYKEQVD